MAGRDRCSHWGGQQKLMRHAHISTTRNAYGNALMDLKRDAHIAINGI